MLGTASRLVNARGSALARRARRDLPSPAERSRIAIRDGKRRLTEAGVPAANARASSTVHPRSIETRPSSRAMRPMPSSGNRRRSASAAQRRPDQIDDHGAATRDPQHLGCHQRLAGAVEVMEEEAREREVEGSVAKRERFGRRHHRGAPPRPTSVRAADARARGRAPRSSRRARDGARRARSRRRRRPSRPRRRARAGGRALLRAPPARSRPPAVARTGVR